MKHSGGVKYTGRINRRYRALLSFVGLGTWVTGGLWLCFHYFFVQKGEFGPTPHPMEAWWLKLHGAFAFAIVWMFGLVWGIHVSKALPHRRRKPSGLTLISVLVALTVTGYLLYYAGSETLRPVISVAHWAIGLASPIAFLLHRGRRRKRKAAGAMKQASQPQPLESESRPAHG